VVSSKPDTPMCHVQLCKTLLYAQLHIAHPSSKGEVWQRLGVAPSTPDGPVCGCADVQNPPPRTTAHCTTARRSYGCLSASVQGSVAAPMLFLGCVVLIG
jgi:hypothetical protein